jgi:membrane associated rhomboid family serine protease
MRQGSSYRISFGGALTPVVKVLIIINVLVYLFLQVARDSGEILLYLGLVPALIVKERFIWQFLSYMFVHVGFMHILFNMLFLWWFGCDIERSFGKKHFLRFYLLCGLGGGLFAFLLSMGSPVPVIGASGAIFGIFLAYAILYPNRRIYLWFLFPVKAKWLVLAAALIEISSVIMTRQTGVSHSAHVGGIITALIWFGYYLKILRWNTLKSLFSRSGRRSRAKMFVVKDDAYEDGRDDFPDDDRNSTIH